VVREHVYIDGTIMDPRPLREAEVVNYADKRVLHEEVVTLAVRFADLKVRYGRTPEALARIQATEVRTRALEENLRLPGPDTTRSVAVITAEGIMGKLRLALIAGGKSSEREVSLKSGAQVYQALDKDKYDIRRYDPLTDLERLVREAGELDAALIIMHGRGGEDGSMQGLLDLLEIPYQGSGVLASALAMNKELSKAVYQLAGLQVPAALAFHRHKAPSPQEIEAKLGLPVVIKPVNEGSSIGISKAPTLEALKTGLAAAFALDNRVLVEEFIPATEVTGGVLGNANLQALPLVEIIPTDKYDFFDYEAKTSPAPPRSSIA
jgi:D-alanine-D-alanine ligase